MLQNFMSKETANKVKTFKTSMIFLFLQDFRWSSMEVTVLFPKYMHLDTMHARYPQLISAKQSLGSQTTQQGRQLYWVKISDHPDMAENENRILFTALHHA